jgi:3-polyprenyl-4-hydroxybenzoate decarboxylase
MPRVFGKGSRSQPAALVSDRDLVFVQRAMGAILDPTSDPIDNTLTKVGVDATNPGGADFAERLTIAEEQRAGYAVSCSPPAYRFNAVSAAASGNSVAPATSALPQ